ncbi:MAG TPA: hypothetical protein VG795_01235 [Acidimicrobiia bacterium]|nr:hypothetical protein [Acidimicrobiia bacterium]
MNDALAPFGPSDKRRLLDGLAQLPDTTQIVYLTDDPDTLAWASDQLAKGDVALWRPEDIAASCRQGRWSRSVGRP